MHVVSGKMIGEMMPSQTPIPFDYHSHHVRCGHAQGEMREYIEAALSLGLTYFGVSDHGPAYFLPGDHALPGTQMAQSELPNYVAEARRLQAEYEGKMNVRVGLEADFIEDEEFELGDVLLSSGPLDYVLGSVHYAFGVSIFNKGRWDKGEAPEEVYEEYYRLVSLAAQSGLFDILSHLTAVEAYGPPIGDDLVRLLYPPVADAVAASGCLVEINTSGYRKMPPGSGRSGDEPFPNRQMLRLLVDRGVPLTFGSDSHQPEQVGFGRDRVLALLHELGVDVTRGPQPYTVRRGPLLAFATR